MKKATMSSVSVIVSACVKGTKVGEGRTFGDRLFDATFPSLDAAMEEGRFQCGDGRSVVVRPSYNEKDEIGCFFREWRSFNGEALKEARFAISEGMAWGVSLRCARCKSYSSDCKCWGIGGESGPFRHTLEADALQRIIRIVEGEVSSDVGGSDENAEQDLRAYERIVDILRQARFI